MAKLGQKPNGIYFLDVTVPDGAGGSKRQRVSCDTRDSVDAERQRKDWVIGAHPKHFSRGAVIAPKGRVDRSNTSVSQKVPEGMTMSKLFDLCENDRRCWKGLRSQATIRSNVNLLNKRIGRELVADMTHTRLCALVDEMLDEGYAPASVKRKMDQVSKALRMACEVYEDANGAPLLRFKPKMPKIAVENEKDRVLSRTEEKLVFAAIDARILKEPGRQWARFRMFVRLLLDTGFRRGEALSLGQHSVLNLTGEDGTERPHLHLPKTVTKNKKARTIPVTPDVAAMFSTLTALSGGGLWFPIKGPWYLWSNIRDDVKEMGGDISDVGLHTLRHTCITRLAKGGMKLHRLSLWAGHSDVIITAKRYAHLDADDLAGGVAILTSNPASSAIPSVIPETSAIQNHHDNGGNRAEGGAVTIQ